MAEAGSPFRAVADGVRIAVRVAPKASHNRISGPVPEAGGGSALKAAVTAAPEDGKANAALIKLLAKEWGVAKTRISVASGATERRKILHLKGEPAALMARLNAWMEGERG